MAVEVNIVFLIYEKEVMGFRFTAASDSYTALLESDDNVKRKLILSFRYIKNKMMISTVMLLIIYLYIFIIIIAKK